MDISIILALVITTLMASCYYIGRILAFRYASEVFPEFFLNLLEKEGFIVTETDEDGDKELIQISSVVAEALRDLPKNVKSK
tara:strand:- start:5404 stop:5649 length:246 start_codon:yes stop_codon:yes gene_type:complete